MRHNLTGDFPQIKANTRGVRDTAAEVMLKKKGGEKNETEERGRENRCYPQYK